jgi:hypothetical protein
MKRPIALLVLAFALGGCSQSGSKAIAVPDPCDELRSLDPHCGWKPHWTDNGPTVNSIDGTKTEFLSLDSSDADGDTLGQLSYAELTICFRDGKLCGGKSVGVSVTVHGMVSPRSYDAQYETQVRLKLDSEKPESQIWGIADSHDAVFPTGREKQFLGQLLKHNQLTLEFSYYEHAPRTLTFELAGLPEAMKSIGVSGR